MIKFSCKNCGQKFSVAEVYAGKKGRCPKCKNVVVIPKRQSPRSTTKPKNSAHDLSLLDVPESIRTQKKPASQTGQHDGASEAGEEPQRESLAEAVEHTGRGNLSRITDIFLYPTSKPGLTNLAIIVGIPTVIAIVQQLLGPFALTLALPRFIINVLIGLYMCWYFAECVRDSAAGGMRAPEAFATADLAEMWSQSLYLVAFYLLLAGPAGFYHIFANKIDTVFWLLLAYGVFFFPVGLLAVIMFDSGAGFNPILWVASIFSTFFPYCGLVILISILALPIVVVMNVEVEDIPLPKAATLALGAILACTFVYIVFVVGHLLGRFYWRYQEKLNWEV